MAEAASREKPNKNDLRQNIGAPLSLYQIIDL
jgi:hypothetical protein